jgi:hypothetical protein
VKNKRIYKKRVETTKKIKIMENIIMAYSLGVLTVALIGAVITGVRLNKRVNELEKLSQNNSQKIDEVSNALRVDCNDVHQRIDETNVIICADMDKRFDDIHRMVDSRIDKMINNPKFCLNK